MLKIRRALLSVYDKKGIVEFAQTLEGLGCEIISTGGTKKVLDDASIRTVDIANFTGNPECFGGRMKTLSFELESALLYNRERDREEASRLGIKPVDLVVCNLYPFEKYWRQGAPLDELVEQIDIGGPTMIRAAAKNYRFVAVVTDAASYSEIINELRMNNGAISPSTRFRLMREAFNYTADYDALISTVMDEKAGVRSLRLAFTDGKELRYGENSHQKAMIFTDTHRKLNPLALTVLHGREISFNNMLDISSAIHAVKSLGNFGCAIIKHTNPCGFCEGDDQRKVFEGAWASDPVSAFGSVIAFNRNLEISTAEFLDLTCEDKSRRKFVEVIAAPSFSSCALEYLKFHKNLRVVEFDVNAKESTVEYRMLDGFAMQQDRDRGLYSELTLKTMEKFKDGMNGLIEFGIKAVRQVKSNAIVIVRKHGDRIMQLIGMGAGQPNRVVSTRLAIQRARETLLSELKDPSGTETDRLVKEKMGDAVLVSDAFFPFADSIDECVEAGIKMIVQPGGSIRDKAVISKCDENGIAMIFTGMRHFKH